MTTESRDIVERMEQRLSTLEEANANGRIHQDDVELSGLLRDAIATIKGYRAVAGGASPGPSFAEITKDIPRRSTEPHDPK